MKTKQFYCMLLCLAGSLLFSQHVNAQVGSVHLNVELPGMICTQKVRQVNKCINRTEFGT